MPIFHTVAPIQNVALDPDARFDFGGDIVLAATPSWVAREKMLEKLGESDRKAVQECPSSFVATYEAAALGARDPAWVGSEPKSIQETKYELCLLANLALWLCRPSPVCFRIVLHARRSGAEPVTQEISRHPRLICHPRDVNNRVTEVDIRMAADLHRSLLKVLRDSSVWTGIRATWIALQANIESVRLALFWMALEALFGPEDAREIAFRLSQRVAFFLSEDRAEAEKIYAMVKKGYQFRSKIVHGHWESRSDGLDRMADAETLVSRSLRRILSEEVLRDTFVGRDRETYLDGLVFRD